MGVNVLLFLVFQIGVEPWRRKRLVKGFEDKVMEALEREGSTAGATPTEVQMAQDATPAEVHEAQEATTPADLEDARVPAATHQLPDPSTEIPLPLDGIVSAKSTTVSKLGSQAQGPMPTFHSIKEWIRDMFSERQIVLRRIDVTTAILEGAATGIAIVGSIVLLLRLKLTM